MVPPLSASAPQPKQGEFCFDLSQRARQPVCITLKREHGSLQELILGAGPRVRDAHSAWGCQAAQVSVCRGSTGPRGASTTGPAPRASRRASDGALGKLQAET